MKRLVFFLILASSMAFGQGSVMRQDSMDASNVAGALKATVAKFDNLIGSANVAIEVKYSGGPATSSIPVLGCMRGGTCTTLGTIVTTTNQLFFVGNVYDYISMTPVLSGGSNPYVTFNYTAISQSSGGGSGLGSTNVQGAVPGGTSGVGTNPVQVGGCGALSGGACNGNVIPFLTTATGAITTVGAGGSNGLAQSNPYYALPNATSGSTCCGGTPIVLAAVTTALNIKASSGALYWVQGTNTTAAACYLQLFDVVQGSVTLGTTAPKMVISLGVVAGAQGSATVSPLGLYFSSTGLSVAATTTPTGAATCATGAVVSAIAS